MLRESEQVCCAVEVLGCLQKRNCAYNATSAVSARYRQKIRRCRIRDYSTIFEEFDELAYAKFRLRMYEVKNSRIRSGV